MTRARGRVLGHYAKLRAGLAIASACAMAPSVVACDPVPRPAVAKSDSPPTATMATDTEVQANIWPPKGDDWKISEVEVKNAKLLSRDGDAPLVLKMERSQPKMGETTVEGADEPIEITVTWRDKKGEKASAVFKLKTSPNAKQGEDVPVTAE